MTTRTITFVAGEYYHVFNRGNSRQAIFRQPVDYRRFQQLLYLSNTSQSFNVRDVLKTADTVYHVKKPDTLVTIGAYCLMPNHFHLLLTPHTDESLSTFMLKLGTAYSMYFNKKYERSGSLYEGRFKAKFVDSDNYLKYLFSYIHLNPIAKKTSQSTSPTFSRHLFEQACHYPYSSLAEYVSPRAALGLIDKGVFEGYFSNHRAIRDELYDWITYDGDESSW